MTSLCCNGVAYWTSLTGNGSFQRTLVHYNDVTWATWVSNQAGEFSITNGQNCWKCFVSLRHYTEFESALFLATKIIANSKHMTERPRSCPVCKSDRRHYYNKQAWNRLLIFSYVSIVQSYQNTRKSLFRWIVKPCVVCSIWYNLLCWGYLCNSLRSICFVWPHPCGPMAVTGCLQYLVYWINFV